MRPHRWQLPEVEIPFSRHPGVVRTRQIAYSSAVQPTERSDELGSFRFTRRSRRQPRILAELIVFITEVFWDRRTH